MDSTGGIWRLLRRFLATRYGDVRAFQELYHLRGIITFAGVFAATIAFPAVLLAYYGFGGVRAEQQALAAEVEQEAEVVLDTIGSDMEELFRSFENATLNRLKSGQSVTTSLPEISDVLRVVFRFDAEGHLQSPWLREEIEPLEDQALFSFLPYQQGWEAERAGDYGRAAALYQQAGREARGARIAAQSQFSRANALARAGEVYLAESIYAQLAQLEGIRDIHGFRVSDLARLKLGERALVRDPSGAVLKGLVEEILSSPWVIGRGGEAAVARRALDLLAGKVDADWTARTRGRLGERATQLFWAEQLIGELDRMGSKGRLLKVATGEFSYYRTDTALWATTWTEEDQYVFALEFAGLVRRVRQLAEQAPGTDSKVRAEILSPQATLRDGFLGRRSLSPWLTGWSVAIYPRDPAALADRQQAELRRGVGIILLSVCMIAVGAVLTARLVRRELDAARHKSDFAARVSHELRSPITQIRLKAEALQLGLATTPEQQIRHYDVIMREAERLSLLVDNILDFAAIERGIKKYSFRPGDIGQTVIKVVETAKVAMEMRGVEIELSLPDDLPAVWHDPDAISQALTNLLSNAAKYGQEAAWVGVTVRADDGMVLVDVADRGIGISAEDQKHIFEQYYRSPDPKAQRRKGTGIGLTIVKYIMEAHGGRVSLRSAPGEGSTFTLHFPTRNPEEA